MDLQEARQAIGKVRRSGIQDGDYFPFQGGLNIVQTPMQLAPGELLAVSNYEPDTLGGYRRLQGYERFDGRPAPSQASYSLQAFTGGTPANYPAIGAIVFGMTSGATGVVIVATVLDNTGLAGTLILGRVTGAFLTAEILKVGVNAFGIANGPNAVNAAASSQLNNAYQYAAGNLQRTLILQVPGFGGILGVVEYRNRTYAFRSNIIKTAVNMWVASAAGWQQIPDYPQLRFINGTVPILAGNTVHGVTSGVNAVVARVVLQSGIWAAGTAQGFLILSPGAYAFVNAETLTVAAVNSATTSGVAAAPVLAIGGSYEFRVKNFYGNSGTIRLYGCDGVNKGFEYQDDFGGQLPFYCPIETGMPIDAPTHLAAHRGRLWLGFRGGSAQPSAVNDPTVWSALNGAAELGVGQEISGFLEEMNPSQSAFYSTATLFVFCDNEIQTITGDGPNWVLGPFATEVGAHSKSMQRLGQGIFLSDRGFSALQAVQQLGNFALATFSQKIQTLIPNISLTLACSSVSRNNSLYRAFLNDGTFVSIGFKDVKVTGHTLCNLNQPMTCAWAGEDASKNELLLLGGANGFVYQMDSGNNLDGNPIAAFILPAFHFSKTPGRQKRYRRAQLDVATSSYTTLTFSPSYNLGDVLAGADPARTVALQPLGGLWDSAIWDAFTWDTSTNSQPSVKLESSGQSISMFISHNSNNDQTHTIQGLTLHRSLRRLDRSSAA